MTLAPFGPTLSALIGVTAICVFVVGFGIYRFSLAAPVLVTLPGWDGG